MTRPLVAYLPTADHTAKVFTPETVAALRAEFDLRENPGVRLSPEAAAEAARGAPALVTGWGVAPLTPALLKAAPGLEIIVHSAGSVRALIPEALLDSHLRPRGIVVATARAAIALNVAEATVGMLIALVRRVVDHTLAFRTTGAWGDRSVSRDYPTLRGGTVGLVSASSVAREVIRLLQPFGARILLYDPFLSTEAAAQLGVTLVSLDDLFRESDFVSVHAPSLPSTDNLIGAAQLRLLKDGAVFFNSSRGSVLDHDALLSEARTGRIIVGLDVTEPEPLPPDSPFRELPNVVITPHETGAGRYGYQEIGRITLAALRDHFAGRPVTGAIDLDAWDRLA